MRNAKPLSLVGPQVVRGKAGYTGLPTQANDRRGGKTEFKRWMEAQGLTAPEVAKQLGVSKGTVRLWANGKLVPGLIHAYRIEVLTNYKVPWLSWLESPTGEHLWKALENASENP